MRFIGIAIVIFLEILCVLSRMLPIDYMIHHPPSDSDSFASPEKSESANEKVVGLRTSEDGGNGDDSEDFGDYDRKHPDPTKKQCGVVVLSRVPNTNMQSLIRKYRYDKNGVLIPSSVKYFIKVPQEVMGSPLLVPLNKRAFSPLGGFVRYYKEVPPIPHSW